MLLHHEFKFLYWVAVMNLCQLGLASSVWTFFWVFQTPKNLVLPPSHSHATLNSGLDTRLPKFSDSTLKISNNLSDSVHNDFSRFRSRLLVWLDTPCISQWVLSGCGTGSSNKKCLCWEKNACSMLNIPLYAWLDYRLQCKSKPCEGRLRQITHRCHQPWGDGWFVRRWSSKCTRQ